MEKRQDIGYVKVRDFESVKRLFKQGNLYYKPLDTLRKNTGDHPEKWDDILNKVKTFIAGL